MYIFKEVITMAKEKISNLAKQWDEESNQMAIPKDEAEKTRTEVRKMKTGDFNWDVVVPKLYPKDLDMDVIDIITGKVDDIAEVIEEHIAAIKWFKEYHKKFGYDAMENLIDFYTKYDHKPDPNFDFDKMLKDYDGSTIK